MLLGSWLATAKASDARPTEPMAATSTTARSIPLSLETSVPLAIIALAFLHKLFGGRRPVYVCTILGTASIALFDGWKAFHGSDSGLSLQLHEVFGEYLPLYTSGLGWILPAVAGFAIGLLLSAICTKNTKTHGQ